MMGTSSASRLFGDDSCVPRYVTCLTRCSVAVLKRIVGGEGAPCIYELTNWNVKAETTNRSV